MHVSVVAPGVQGRVGVASGVGLACRFEHECVIIISKCNCLQKRNKAAELGASSRG
jgi:hypothetical protein